MHYVKVAEPVHLESANPSADLSADSGLWRLGEAEACFAERHYKAALQSLDSLEELRDLSARDAVRLYSLLANCHARLEQPATGARSSSSF